jgi:transcriptional repressor NrdR
MQCPTCGSVDNRVVDSRSAEEGTAIRRRRMCEVCGARFTTFERPEDTPLLVIKRDGRREPLERAKLQLGVRAACKGRPVGDEAINDLVVQAEEAVRLLGGEVESARIGALVLERLRPLDGVAAVRFASVYKGFEGPEDFEAELRLLDRQTGD